MGDPLDLGKIGHDEITPESNEPRAEVGQRRLFERKESSHKRDQTTRGNIHTVSIMALWVVALVSLGFVIVWAWHMLAPGSLYFVTESQLDTIQAVLVSIVGSSFILVG